MTMRGRHALILGYGRSGRAAASFIAARGGSVRVVDRADTPELKADLDRAGITGRLGGYGWGVHRKSWLLDHEAANRSATDPAGLLLRRSP